MRLGTHISMIVAAAVCSAGQGAFAQSAPVAAVTPQAYMQLATPAAAGAEVDLYRVPVVTSTGALVYKNVRLHFDVSAAGALSVTSGYPVFSNSPPLLSGNFVMGKYSLSGVFYDVSGGGAGQDGRTSWGMNLESSSNGCLVSASWTTGPVAGNPAQQRLQTAKITYAGYAYGTIGAVSCTQNYGIPFGWHSGYLIGAASTGNGVTLYRYTDNNGVDQSSPVDSISLQKCPATGTC